MAAAANKPTKTNILPDELIMVIFSQIETNTLEKNLTKVHKAIYYLKQDPKYTDYFEEFDFDEMGLSPYSDLLDQVLSRLETSHLLDTSNPSYSTYTIKNDYMKKEYERLHPYNKKIIREMGKKFLECF